MGVIRNTYAPTNEGGYYLDDHCNDLATAPNGDFVLVSGYIDAWRIRPNGELVWQKFYDAFVHAADIFQTQDIGFVIAGNVLGRSQLYLLKIDADGTGQWTKSFETNPSQRSDSFCQNYSLLATIDGGYFVTGGDCLIKVDSKGNLVWMKSLQKLYHERLGLTLFNSFWKYSKAVQLADESYLILHSVLFLKILFITPEIFAC